MNRSKLKNYAPKARRDFIQAVADRAAFYGLTKNKIEPVKVQGDVAVIRGTAFPKIVAEQRSTLEERINREGFEQVMEAIAYTWFNRFVAIRYMELHGYLDHGYRVLSHPEGQSTPEIVQQAEHVDLPELDKQRVIELKLDGTKEEELYRMLLLGQCHALHQAMPFLFESIGDETELLLPDGLTRTDSLIRQLVEQVDEDQWQDIEVIGWLYQFYISEKKDQVIGKVVKSEDIPAATQLFTPKWIVKYMVQNSLGAQWLATYPQSPLKGQMEYYIEPAEQSGEVKAQLADIRPSQLNPEELTLIDPASGSGHILVEAYELFKALYLERGYRQRDVPKLILEKNLFGLEIDGRAAQLTGFALMMKGRADDRRLFERGVKLNVMALQDSAAFDAEGLAKGVELGDYGLNPGDLAELMRLFEHATTFGSLIQVPEGLAEKLSALGQLSEATSQDLFVSDALKRLRPLVQQAELLSARYDAVVANPPYMGRKYQVAAVKDFLKQFYLDVNSDLFSAFVVRCSAMGSATARVGIMSPNVWMYISTHEDLRNFISMRRRLISLVELPLSGFKGATVQICTYIIGNARISKAKGDFIRLVDFKGGDPEMATYTKQAIRNRECGWMFVASPDDFKMIDGSPVAYSISDRMRRAFTEGVSFEEEAMPRQGLGTTDNRRFVRGWSEVRSSKICLDASDAVAAKESKKKWFPYSKGGGFRKWYGNEADVVNWENDGEAVREALIGKNPNIPRSERHYFKEGITWGLITSAEFSARHTAEGAIFDVGGSKAFPRPESQMALLGLLNSKITKLALQSLNPTLNFQVGDLKRIPVVQLASLRTTNSNTVSRAVALSQHDWNAYERSWDFQTLPLLTACSDPTPTLEFSYTAWITQNRDTIAEMKRLEEENNRLFIDAYGLSDELNPHVPIEQITLTVNPAYRYGGKLTEEEQWTRFRQDTMEELVSYAIGCMMGRYSLDAPGLIYAHSGGEDFDPGRYKTFAADDDGVIPINDFEWFDDDAANRVVEFIRTAWPKEHLQENLDFMADSLGRNKGEDARDTLRRYLANDFFKDHLSTYKRRPIYWLFSSGKEKAFQALVYLHRYNEGTLSRMRTEYVIELQGKLSARIDHLTDEIDAATSTSHGRKLEKERDKLKKQQTELQQFDEKLKHYAEKRITLDLDDGVKVNYGKFGSLLAEVKAVTGKKPDVD